MKKIFNVTDLKHYIKENDNKDGVPIQDVINNSNNPNIEDIIREAEFLGEIIEFEGFLRIADWEDEKLK